MAEQPSLDFRPNPDRAVYLSGEINQALVDRLTPEIMRFRAISTDPITVYVDSPGGDIRSAEVLRELVRCSGQDCKPIRLLPVATGWAASAAADFLALGDYCLAFPHARILYHGSRRFGQFELTVERASILARNLQQANDMFADRLARTIFPRFLLRVLLLDENHAIQAYIKAATGDHGHPDIQPIVDALRKQISNPVARLVERSRQVQQSIQAMDATVLNKIKKKTNIKVGTPEFERVFFQSILEFKTKKHRGEPWMLSDGGLAEVASDFDLLHDFHFGSHTKTLTTWVSSFGPMFLSEEQRHAFNDIPKEDDGRRLEYLQKHASRKIRMLWYFVVSFCRGLQKSDYEFTPFDAYWMGLVNEVIGTDLANERILAENTASVAENAKA